MEGTLRRVTRPSVPKTKVKVLMSVVIFHDANVKEARDNKRVTSKNNKGKETLLIKDEKKDMLVGIEVKS